MHSLSSSEFRSVSLGCRGRVWEPGIGTRIFDELGRGKSEPGERIVPNSGQILSHFVLSHGQASGPALGGMCGTRRPEISQSSIPNRVLTGYRQLASVRTANDNRQFPTGKRRNGNSGEMAAEYGRQ